MIKDTDMIGHTFGKWTVLEKGEKKTRQKWVCQCECGTIRQVEGTTLRTGRSTSCGCNWQKSIKDLTNQQFGELIALAPTPERKDGSVVWKCLCSCGKECFISSHSLNRGTRSCGHLIGDNLRGGKDITNQRFGKLIAIEPTELRKDHSVIWRCNCDCGKEVYVSIHHLQEGKVKSCGCLNRSFGEEKIFTLLTNHNIVFETEKILFGQYRFDFYVNQTYLIEFDGKQHFTFTGGSGWFSKETYEETKKRDQIKNEWCKTNNIPLIRIPYTHEKELCIEDLLLETTKYRVV